MERARRTCSAAVNLPVRASHPAPRRATTAESSRKRKSRSWSSIKYFVVQRLVGVKFDFERTDLTLSTIRSVPGLSRTLRSSHGQARTNGKPPDRRLQPRMAAPRWLSEAYRIVAL